MAKEKFNTADSQLIAGRKAEIATLKSLLESKESELLAIYGRRRVGKSFLIKKAYEAETIFSFTGTNSKSKNINLKNFIDQINQLMKPAILYSKPKDWREAFKVLQTYIETTKTRAKKVIVLDELPWLATRNSGFLAAFDYFWNSWAVNQNMVVVICGSAASWIIENVINDKGGLHNRVTKKINLQPFTLTETEQYFKSKNINFTKFEITQIYMALGGIPFYLREVKAGKSVPKEIDRICFGKNAPLYGEFDNLYKALFSKYENHLQIIRVLAKKRKGLTRMELLSQIKMNSGGTLTTTLKELEASSFITFYKPFGKQERDSLYRLTDEYSYFYLQYVLGNEEVNGFWVNQTGTPAYKAWGGFTFETLCLKHIDKIKIALGISGVFTEASSYFFGGNTEIPSFQIDLIIDRNDSVINLCEMKYYTSDYLLTKKDAESLRNKAAYFQLLSKTKKRVVITLITSYKLMQSINNSVVDEHLCLEDIFY
jgi:uncharacterized protein